MTIPFWEVMEEDPTKTFFFYFPFILLFW
jgi:hypothetical protein